MQAQQDQQLDEALKAVQDSPNRAELDAMDDETLNKWCLSKLTDVRVMIVAFVLLRYLENEDVFGMPGMADVLPTGTKRGFIKSHLIDSTEQMFSNMIFEVARMRKDELKNYSSEQIVALYHLHHSGIKDLASADLLQVSREIESSSISQQKALKELQENLRNWKKEQTERGKQAHAESAVRKA